jgi:hypothetical protein
MLLRGLHGRCATDLAASRLAAHLSRMPRSSIFAQKKIQSCCAAKYRAARPTSNFDTWARSSVRGCAARSLPKKKLNVHARPPGSCAPDLAALPAAAHVHLIFFWAKIELRSPWQSCAPEPLSCATGRAYPPLAGQLHLIFFCQRPSSEAAGGAARPVLEAAQFEI